ncbi:MAG: imidazole glycerol phosphate synthase subunit HisF [Coriobacteriales bacterium]|nr:imidazole glycerol phosphate synthase subunit HisF [Coriobacteriales bacterium]
MITKRIIPCLDVRNGRVVKGTKFQGLNDVDDPVNLAKFYSECGADELVFYDITASAEARDIFVDVVREVANNVYIPFTVGGGINKLDDFNTVLRAGADKVSVNSSAVKNPQLIHDAALKFGSQCVVLSIDAKYNEERESYDVYVNGGRVNTQIDAIEWARKGVELGAGEIVANSIDTDGVKEGFNIDLLNRLCDAVNVPIIASGGAGNMQHFLELFQQTNADAGLAASIFHFGEVQISDLKQYLLDNKINMRV